MFLSQDFGNLMRNNILVPLKRNSNSNADGLVEKMRSRLERHTKYWPMTISSTLMFNIKQVCILRKCYIMFLRKTFEKVLLCINIIIIKID